MTFTLCVHCTSGCWQEKKLTDVTRLFPVLCDCLLCATSGYNTSIYHETNKTRDKYDIIIIKLKTFHFLA